MNTQNTQSVIEIGKSQQRLEDGRWLYDFTAVPQEGRYIKVYWLILKSGRVALNRAKKINLNFTYKVKEIQTC